MDKVISVEMGKVEQHNEGVPDISPQTEASKLLEAALLQMDGIISGLLSLNFYCQMLYISSVSVLSLSKW